MTFSKLLPILLVMLMTGCGQIAIKERQSESSEYAAQEDTENVNAEIVRTPNPYLENRRSVPGKAKQIFAQANGAMQAKKWREAEKILLTLTAGYPKLSGPYLNLGIVYLEMDKPIAEAEQQFAKAIEVNSNNLEAYNRLASVKRQQGEFQEAEKLYLKALSVWPQHLASNLNLGILYDLYLRDLAKAQRYYEQYQLLLPEPDKRVAGWLVDIKRRLKVVAQNEPQGVQ